MNVDRLQELLAEALTENSQLKALLQENSRLLVSAWTLAEKEGHAWGPALGERVSLAALPQILGPVLDARLRAVAPVQNGADDAGAD